MDLQGTDTPAIIPTILGPRAWGVNVLAGVLAGESPFALWLFLSDEEAGVEGGMAMGLASASGGFKSAKSAKGAKGANPWRLAPLALLGRAGDPIVAEA